MRPFVVVVKPGLCSPEVCAAGYMETWSIVLSRNGAERSRLEVQI